MASLFSKRSTLGDEIICDTWEYLSFPVFLECWNLSRWFLSARVWRKVLLLLFLKCLFREYFFGKKTVCSAARLAKLKQFYLWLSQGKPKFFSMYPGKDIEFGWRLNFWDIDWKLKIDCKLLGIQLLLLDQLPEKLISNIW